MRLTLTALLLASASIAQAQTPASQTPASQTPSAAAASAAARAEAARSQSPTAAQASRDAAIRARLAGADTNKGGSYTRTEWLAAGRKAAQFDTLDANKDSLVTQAEIRAGAIALNAKRDHKSEAGSIKPTPAQAARDAAIRDRMNAADANHDGQFTKAEWLAAGRRAAVFDRTDANKDGIVSAAEIRASAEALDEAREHPQAKTVKSYR